MSDFTYTISLLHLYYIPPILIVIIIIGIYKKNKKLLLFGVGYLSLIVLYVSAQYISSYVGDRQFSKDEPERIEQFVNSLPTVYAPQEYYTSATSEKLTLSSNTTILDMYEFELTNGYHALHGYHASYARQYFEPTRDMCNLQSLYFAGEITQPLQSKCQLVHTASDGMKIYEGNPNPDRSYDFYVTQKEDTVLLLAVEKTSHDSSVSSVANFFLSLEHTGKADAINNFIIDHPYPF